MTNEERVVEFKAKLDKVFRTYFITELCANAIEIIVSVIVLLNVLKTDNQRALMLTVFGIFVVIFLTSSVTIRVFFGSVSGLTRVVNFRTKFDFVTKNLSDAKSDLEKGKISFDEFTIVQTIYDDEIKNLAEQIDSFKLKK